MKIIKYIIGGLLTFILGSIIFLVISITSMAKVTGVIKNVIYPFYAGEFPAIGTIVLFIISLMAFFWLMHKEIIHNRPILFSITFGFITSTLMLYSLPFMGVSFTVSNMINSHLDINQSNKNLAISSAKRMIGHNINMAPIYLDKIDLETVSYANLPYAAFSYEMSEKDDHQVKAAALWQRFYQESLARYSGDKELTLMSYQFSYMTAVFMNFRSYSDSNQGHKMLKRSKEELLTLANMTKYGIGREKDTELANKMYQFMIKDRFYIADYIMNKYNPEYEKRSLVDYIIINPFK